MTYETQEAAKKVKLAIQLLADRAHAVSFQEGELAHLHNQIDTLKVKLKRERDLYDVQLEKVLELFPALGAGFKPESLQKTVKVGDDGMVHVVEIDPAAEHAGAKP